MQLHPRHGGSGNERANVGRLIQLASMALVQNVVLGPWIHVGSKVRLGDKHRNLTFRARLIFRVWRVCRHGQCPQTSPFRRVLDLTHAHRAYAGLIAKLDMLIGAQVMYPGRIFRRSSLRPDENIVIAFLDAHQRCLPNRTRLIAPVSHDDDR
jgi:hypothetical protein